MKETDALKKQCPIGSYRVDRLGMHKRNCIGSDCMWWQSWEYMKGNILMLPGEGDCGFKIPIKKN